MKIYGIGSLGTFVSGIVSYFDIILTPIPGNTSPAKLHFKHSDRSIRRLALAERASVASGVLTQQPPDPSESNAKSLEPVFISEILRDTASFVLSRTNVRCNFSIPDNLWAVEVDVGQISQVISNLIVNAEQAMPHGGVIDINAENIFSDAEHDLHLKYGKYIKISIRDQGTGISEEHLQKIFDLYFTTKQKGNGLGLTIVQSIIENHNGYIAVESQVGAGTTFHIYLPASPEMILIEKRMEERLFMGEGKILVMDNEEMVRDLIREMLGRIGYEVVTAGEGAEAVALYKEAQDLGQPFDAAILDLTIPGGMGGKDTIQKLIKIDPEVKAIISSGYTNHPVMTNFREYGFTSVIPKPYEIRELSEILSSVVKRNGRRV